MNSNSLFKSSMLENKHKGTLNLNEVKESHDENDLANEHAKLHKLDQSHSDLKNTQLHNELSITPNGLDKQTPDWPRSVQRELEYDVSRLYNREESLEQDDETPYRNPDAYPFEDEHSEGDKYEGLTYIPRTPIDDSNNDSSTVSDDEMEMDDYKESGRYITHSDGLESEPNSSEMSIININARNKGNKAKRYDKCSKDCLISNEKNIYLLRWKNKDAFDSMLKGIFRRTVLCPLYIPRDSLSCFQALKFVKCTFDIGEYTSSGTNCALPMNHSKQSNETGVATLLALPADTQQCIISSKVYQSTGVDKELKPFSEQTFAFKARQTKRVLNLENVILVYRFAMAFLLHALQLMIKGQDKPTDNYVDISESINLLIVLLIELVGHESIQNTTHLQQVVEFAFLQSFQKNDVTILRTVNMLRHHMKFLIPLLMSSSESVKCNEPRRRTKYATSPEAINMVKQCMSFLKHVLSSSSESGKLSGRTRTNHMSNCIIGGFDNRLTDIHLLYGFKQSDLYYGLYKRRYYSENVKTLLALPYLLMSDHKYVTSYTCLTEGAVYKIENQGFTYKAPGEPTEFEMHLSCRSFISHADRTILLTNKQMQNLCFLNRPWICSTLINKIDPDRTNGRSSIQKKPYSELNVKLNRYVTQSNTTSVIEERHIDEHPQYPIIALTTLNDDSKSFEQTKTSKRRNRKFHHESKTFLTCTKKVSKMIKQIQTSENPERHMKRWESNPGSPIGCEQRTKKLKTRRQAEKRLKHENKVNQTQKQNLLNQQKPGNWTSLKGERIFGCDKNYRTHKWSKKTQNTGMEIVSNAFTDQYKHLQFAKSSFIGGYQIHKQAEKTSTKKCFFCKCRTQTVIGESMKTTKIFNAKIGTAKNVYKVQHFKKERALGISFIGNCKRCHGWVEEVSNPHSTTTNEIRFIKQVKPQNINITSIKNGKPLQNKGKQGKNNRSIDEFETSKRKKVKKNPQIRILNHEKAKKSDKCFIPYCKVRHFINRYYISDILNKGKFYCFIDPCKRSIAGKRSNMIHTCIKFGWAKTRKPKYLTAKYLATTFSNKDFKNSTLHERYKISRRPNNYLRTIENDKENISRRVQAHLQIKAQRKYSKFGPEEIIGIMRIHRYKKNKDVIRMSIENSQMTQNAKLVTQPIDDIDKNTGKLKAVQRGQTYALMKSKNATNNLTEGNASVPRKYEDSTLARLSKTFPKREPDFISAEFSRTDGSILHCSGSFAVETTKVDVSLDTGTHAQHGVVPNISERRPIISIHNRGDNWMSSVVSLREHPDTSSICTSKSRITPSPKDNKILYPWKRQIPKEGAQQGQHQLINTCSIDGFLVMIFFELHFNLSIRNLCRTSSSEFYRILHAVWLHFHKRQFNEGKFTWCGFGELVKGNEIGISDLKGTEWQRIYSVFEKNQVKLREKCTEEDCRNQTTSIESKTSQKVLQVIAKVGEPHESLTNKIKRVFKNYICHNMGSCEHKTMNGESCRGTKTSVIESPPLFVPVNLFHLSSGDKKYFSKDIPDKIEVSGEIFDLKLVQFYKNDHFTDKISVLDEWTYYDNKEGNLCFFDKDPDDSELSSCFYVKRL